MDIIDSPQDIQNSLLEWFRGNGRYWIPWKLKKDGSIPQLGESISPYGIWIAEVMLQQTQLKIVIPYWEKWMKVFPTLTSLAEADLESVLMIWQGLGYYSRANRIYQSSKILVELVGKNIDQDPHSCPLQNFCVAHTKYDHDDFPKKNDQNKASSRNRYWSCF